MVNVRFNVENVKTFKWIGTSLVLTGILLTNLNIYPVNIVTHGLGALSWTVAGYIAKDKAILTNFSLQLPLFFMGIINAFTLS
jgi:hypothetical protein